jgi:hypothetical protein
MNTKELAGQLREIADLIHVGPLTPKIIERCRELAGEVAPLNDSPWVSRAADVLHDLGWNAAVDQFDRGRPADADRLRTIADRIDPPDSDTKQLLTAEDVLQAAGIEVERRQGQSKKNYERAIAARVARFQADGLPSVIAAGKLRFTREAVRAFFTKKLPVQTAALKKARSSPSPKTPKRLSPSKVIEPPPAAGAQEGGAA